MHPSQTAEQHLLRYSTSQFPVENRVLKEYKVSKVRQVLKVRQVSRALRGMQLPYQWGQQPLENLGQMHPSQTLEQHQQQCLTSLFQEVRWVPQDLREQQVLKVRQAHKARKEILETLASIMEPQHRQTLMSISGLTPAEVLQADLR